MTSPEEHIAAPIEVIYRACRFITETREDALAAEARGDAPEVERLTSILAHAVILLRDAVANLNLAVTEAEKLELPHHPEVN